MDRGPSLSGMADYGCISGLTVFTSVSGPGAVIKVNGHYRGNGHAPGRAVMTCVCGPSTTLGISRSPLLRSSMTGTPVACPPSRQKVNVRPFPFHLSRPSPTPTRQTIMAPNGWGHNFEIPQTREKSYHQNWDDARKPLSGQRLSMFHTRAQQSKKIFSDHRGPAR